MDDLQLFSDSIADLEDLIKSNDPDNEGDNGLHDSF